MIANITISSTSHLLVYMNKLFRVYVDIIDPKGYAMVIVEIEHSTNHLFIGH